MPRRPGRTAAYAAALAAALVAGGCTATDEPGGSGRPADPPQAQRDRTPEVSPSREGEPLTLAFAGDVHVERHLRAVLRRPGATLGPMSRHLRAADLAMVNLESAVATGGGRAAKELESPADRYWFRSPPRVLQFLDRSGVDVVTVANNHGADYGAAGLQQTLAAAADSPVAVVGVGADAEAAFAPHRVSIGGTDVSVLAADASRRESDDPTWAAGEGGPGIASARHDRPRRLLRAVGSADARGDLVVVYLHWGEEFSACPSDRQVALAEALADAGADVVVGSHAHVLLGAGMLGDTYVSYGLGNFFWYHGARSRTGVLTVRVVDGRVAGHEFVPARIPISGGAPQPLAGARLAVERSRWEALRRCTDLRPAPGASTGEGATREQGDPDGSGGLPAYEADVRRIGANLRARMTSSHDPDACPVAWADLRHVRVSYVGFDGRRHTGELVVHADHARDVVGVFEELYGARWPIRRMRLVDDYGGDDDRSMAANNTSAYNCRTVAGQENLSAHAYGAAIDINPVQNPYLTDEGVLPPAGRSFAQVDRSAGARPEPGVIVRGDVVTRAFAAIGWSWGGRWSEPDYQHFTAR